MRHTCAAPSRHSSTLALPDNKSASYAYDGAGNRIRQTVGTDITKYLLDVQPGLAVVLSATTGTDTTRYVHGSRGIHAQQDNAGAWDWLLQDGLGSVRAVVDGTLAVQERRMYAPYGEPYDGVGTSQTVYGFTGEPTDANELVYLRARYLNPGLGVFVSLDPLEGAITRPMSLNRYAWVEGNAINRTDPRGLQAEGVLATCAAFIAGDGPFPVGDAACVITLFGAGVLAWAGISYAASQLDVQALSRWLEGRYYYPPGGVEVTVTPDGDVYFPNGYENVFSSPTVTAVAAPEPELEPTNTPTPEGLVDPVTQPDPCPPTSTPTPTPTPQVNLDTSTVIRMAERGGSVHTTAIQNWIGTRQKVITQAALNEVTRATSRFAGPSESALTSTILAQTLPIPDNPSPRFAALTPSGSLQAPDIIIFGTGDQLGIETTTGDVAAVRRLAQLGIYVRVFIHQFGRYRGV